MPASPDLLDDLMAALLASPGDTLRAMDLNAARDSLHAFAGMIEIPGAPLRDEEEDPDLEGSEPAYRPVETPQATHHKVMLDVFEAVESGAVRRAMFFLPPGSAKSTYGSVVFPPWFIGRARRRNALVTSYGTTLARKLGRRARSIIKQPIFQEIFGIGLSAESAAADEWSLTNENEFMAGGILSGITGNRFDLIVIDDPIKGRREADSEATRKSTLEAYQADVKTRLKPGGRIVLIQTRWHERDLAGSILPLDYDGRTGWVKGQDGEWWFVVCIPAMAEREDDPLGRQIGEYIWPEWFDETHWNSFRRDLRTWAALFQQRPAPDEGTFFKKHWFKRWAALPDRLHYYITSDHAPGGDPDADAEAGDLDYSCVRVWGIDAQSNVYLVAGFRRRETLDKMADAVLQLVKVYKPFAWFPEDDNNWKSIAGFVRRQFRARKVWCRIEPISPHGADKPTKAQAFQGMAAAGQVFLPDTPEGDDVLAQYLKFPAGAHDDEVDAAALIGRAIDMAHPAIALFTDTPEKPKRYAKKKRAASGWAE